MNTCWRTLRFAALLAGALLAGTAPAWAGGRHHYPHHGYRGHSGVSWGVGIALPPPYWGGWPPAYGPVYGPPWGGNIAIGYGGGYRSGWSVGLSLPLYIGPRYAPAPVPVAVPATRPAPRQAPADCLQMREYQTELVIDGRTVPAYGQACLQADGSWRMVSAPVAADY